MTAATKLRIALGTVGVGVLAYGAWGIMTDSVITARVEIGQWLVAAVIAHDALLAPVVFLLCAAAFRVTGARLRGRLAAGLLIGGSLVLIAIPGLTQQGRNVNRTVLPLDYARNLGVLLAALAAALLLLSALDAVRARRSPEPIAETAPAIEEVASVAAPNGEVTDQAGAQEPRPRSEVPPDGTPETDTASTGVVTASGSPRSPDPTREGDFLQTAEDDAEPEGPAPGDP
jgi:hypothetical protein